MPSQRLVDFIGSNNHRPKARRGEFCHRRGWLACFIRGMPIGWSVIQLGAPIRPFRRDFSCVFHCLLTESPLLFKCLSWARRRKGAGGGYPTNNTRTCIRFPGNGGAKRNTLHSSYFMFFTMTLIFIFLIPSDKISIPHFIFH